jgi:hypothetical protein
VRSVQTLIAALAGAGAGAVMLPAGAARAASQYQRVPQVYERAGSIPACEFSSPELESALKGVDSYGAQYFADFTQAIHDALSRRASGACSGASSGGGGGGGRGAGGGGGGGGGGAEQELRQRPHARIAPGHVLGGRSPGARRPAVSDRSRV